MKIDSDNVDSDLSLSGRLERPAPEDRAEEPSHISDVVHLHTDSELESQLQSDTEFPPGPAQVGPLESELPSISAGKDGFWWFCLCCLATTQGELRKFMRLQELGLEARFQCKKCRSC